MESGLGLPFNRINSSIRRRALNTQRITCFAEYVHYAHHVNCNGARCSIGAYVLELHPFSNGSINLVTERFAPVHMIGGIIYAD
jgi:hypothetical protein